MMKERFSTKQLREIGNIEIDSPTHKFISNQYQDLMAVTSGQYQVTHITTINSPINRGISFHCDKMTTSSDTWKSLLFGSINELLEKGYALDHGYVETSEEKGGQKTKYYLFIKPSLRLRAQIPVKQLFGNLFFELSYVNDAPMKWQILSNVYHGRQYQEPLTLNELIVGMWEKYK